MEISAKIYTAKILLFGEYSVINGSDALAMPTALFSGSWDFDLKIAQQQGILYDFHAYLSNLEFEHATFQQQVFKRDLDRHLIFNSNIPIGYGAGSSGAVCAAIFDQYFQKDSALSILNLKNILAEMEGFFHGSSSGLDPLVSYLNQAILIQDKQINPIKTPKSNDNFHLFLLDTGIPRKTEPLVNLYLKKYDADLSFQDKVSTELAVFNNQAIQYFLKRQSEYLFQCFHQISTFQMEHFKEMIPQGYELFWEAGLKSNFYKIKLCGAGGGGFLLGITKDWNVMKARELKHKEHGLKLFKIF